MLKFQTMAIAVAACFIGSTAVAADAASVAFNKPLHIVAPAAPGGILDQTSRLVAKSLSEVVGQPVIVDNAPGAGGAIGIQTMLRAKPDGYTLVMGSLGPNAANYTLRKNLPYKASDLTPVIHVLSMPNVLVANPQLGDGHDADLDARRRCTNKRAVRLGGDEERGICKTHWRSRAWRLWRCWAALWPNSRWGRWGCQLPG